MIVRPRKLANAIRALAMDAVNAANSGYPGTPMGSLADHPTCVVAVDHRDDVLPKGPLRVSIEAGATFGGERYVLDGLRFGVDGSGASAPIEDLYKHFGLTADAITPEIIAQLERNTL